MLLGVGLPSLAFAQDDAADDEIVVTGSRIPSANAVTASPVTTIGNVEFDIRGTTRVEDLVNTLPQALAAQGANTSNGATGTAQVNLRGLGAVRTLVLVDGRRLQYGSAISSAPDVNQIPAALVERVEVLTGGASAVYGSDAIGGVVNFIMIKDFEGVRVDGQLSGYQHSNGNDLAELENGKRGFPLPEKNAFDGRGQEVTLIIGANTEDGRGNVTAYAGYRNNDAILQADRDHSACAYQARSLAQEATQPPPLDENGLRCGGSATGAIGTFFVVDPISNPIPGIQPDATPGTYTLDTTTGNTFVSGADLFNFAPTNFFQRPDERYVLGAFAHYEVNEHLDAYMDAMFYDYTSDAQIAFSGNFGTTSTVNCDNPLLSAQQASIICGMNAGVAGQIGGVYPLRRLVEGNPRNDHIRLTSFRIVGGVKGAITDGWSYDAFFQYANTHNAQQYENDVSTTRLRQAMDVIDADPGPGVVPVCRDPSNGCVPFNPWSVGGITPAAAAFVSVPSFQDGNTYQYMGQINLIGDLGQYGMKSPWAEDGIGLAGGFEWRKDQLDYRPDLLFQSGDLSGQGGTTPPTSGTIENTDFFVEAKVPLASGMAFAESLGFEGGYRHSDNSVGGSFSSWKLLGDWQVTPEIRVRGGWQRAVRAPNVIESFSPQQTGLTVLSEDPCGPTMLATPAQCAFTGLNPLQYGAPNLDSPASQYNGIFGGNPNLGPETSDTYTVGIVLTPGDYVPGNLLLSVDYFDITVDDVISTITAQSAMDNCIASGDPAFCSLINRGPSGSLWQSASSGFLLNNQNLASLATSGIDINANWGFDFDEIGLGNAGGFNLDLVGTYLLEFEIGEFPGSPILACDGFYGGGCGSPRPEWRHKLRATWEMPIGVDFSVTHRMFTSVDRDGGAADPDSFTRKVLESRHYIDVAASYNIFENWNVRVGVNNITDKDPPSTTETAGFSNGNTYPQTYDAQGRYLFLGTTIDF
jgi:outer membrane receptor protein involved in Fe transport